MLAKRHHPDAGGDEELFKQIGIAFYVLSDPQSREEYDKLMRVLQGDPLMLNAEGVNSLSESFRKNHFFHYSGYNPGKEEQSS